MEGQNNKYPATHRSEVVDNLHGTDVPDPYIPDAKDIRVYKLIHGPHANLMDSIKPFKLNYIKEFPYETTVNFKLLPTDINREIRSYIL